ncbi:radical SAM protein [Patescibacteria group bacterium]|nr:radical SAM protein [Patescibacteria group bacterium]MBU1891066.1 radical SAM protein [Patescibacteria group bacterium]
MSNGVAAQTSRKNIDLRYAQQPTPSGLRYGIVEVTTKCQCRCPGCYMVRRSALNQGEMSIKQSFEVLDLCRDYCGRELETMDILGGEPLLWPYLQEYVEVLLRRGIQPWVFTNMLSITPDLARWLFERQVHITGKLNVANPNNPEQLQLQATMIGTSTATARKMFQSIDIFLTAGYRDPLFRLQNLIRKSNLPLVPDYIVYCRSRNIGVDLELMASGEPVGPDYFEIAPSAEELAGLIRELERRGQGWSAPTQDPPPEFVNPRDKLLMPHLFGSCPFFDRGLYFGVDGHIRACSNSTQTLARVTDSDPIKTAFESELICNRLCLTQLTVGEPCHSCDRWEKCRGGCRATIEGQGDPNGGYSLCPLPYL